MEKVAIIGAGPGGLIAARFLKSQGFAPQIFESHSSVGGQWDYTNCNSGIWPQMVTNTYLEATRFSDMEYPEGTPLFPHSGIVLQYLQDFSAKFDLLHLVKFGCILKHLERGRTDYLLSFECAGKTFTEIFPKVVIATGRYNRPFTPDIKGIDSFQGDVLHTFEYKDPHKFRGQNVVVAGSSISALEIASDLSMLGANKVYLAQRRQRYVFPKMVKGVPLEYYVFNYGSAMVSADGTPEDVLEIGKASAYEYAGDPSRYGTPMVNADFEKAGATGSQHYLNLVAEGRVVPVPWFDELSINQARMTDGTVLTLDTIMFGTGFQLNLPFLSKNITNTLKVTSNGLDLHQFTFHPDFPGLAIIGQWSQQGSYPTVLEQQARYIAYSWGGLVNETEIDLRAGVKACNDDGHHDDYRNQNEMALRFARLSGTDPLLKCDASLEETFKACATTSLLYRVVGPDAFHDGFAQLQQQLKRYGP